MLSGSRLVAFVGADDLDVARSFYVGTLGLTLIDESRYALEFDVAGTMLRVTKVQACQAAPYTVLGWHVPDIMRSVEELAGKGVVLQRYPGMQQDPRGIWTSPSGAQVAWFKDPFGNVLSLTEFPPRLT